MVAQIKKIWEKPELIILVRNTPEESVLAVCKQSSSATFPGSHYDSCTAPATVCDPDKICCCSCQTLSTS